MSATRHVGAPPPVVRHRLRLVWPVLYILSPIVPLLFFLAGNWYSILDGWSLAIVFGTTSYVYFLNQFITGVRLKYFDRIYGLDRVLRFHVIMAVVALGCAWLHHQIFDGLEYEGDELQLRLGAVAILLFTGISVVSLLFFAGPLVRLRPIRLMRRWVQRRLGIQYHHLRVVHNVVAVAMLSALLHALLASVTQESVWRVAVMAGWYVGATTVYILHKTFFPRRRARAAYSVAKIVPESHNYCTVYLEPPGEAPLVYAPGQFGFVRFVSGQQSREDHPYTFSSAPHTPYVSITAKNMGDWSGRLLEAVKLHDKVALEAPYGKFSYTIVRSESSPLVFVARGSGITPFMSMVAALAHQKSERTMWLLWELADGEENFLESRLAHHSAELKNFQYRVYHATPHARATEDVLSATGAPTLEGAHFFLCGNPRFYRATEGYLRNQGVLRRAIHTEKFEF